jgi:hypothetical protein
MDQLGTVLASGGSKTNPESRRDLLEQLHTMLGEERRARDGAGDGDGDSNSSSPVSSSSFGESERPSKPHLKALQKEAADKVCDVCVCMCV